MEPKRVLRDDLMGTMMSITAYGSGAAINAAYGRIEEIHRVFDVNDPESPVSVLNRDGLLEIENEAALRDFENVLELSEWAEGVSKGGFSHRIGELVSLWGIGTGNGIVPAPDALADALYYVPLTHVFMKASEVRLAGGSLDFGAVAKGYACDEAVRVLREQGMESALLDLGGNIFAMGKKPDGKPWRIGLRSPLGDGAQIGAVTLTDRAAVTSGSYERWFERDGKRYHHILDPETGYPAESGLLSVTILYSEAGVADTISTACFVLGLDRGRELVSGISGMGAVFITEALEVYTVGDVGDFTLSDSRFTIMGEAA